MYFLPFIIASVFYFSMIDEIKQDVLNDDFMHKIGRSIIPLIIYYFLTKTVRSRLFFKLPVSDFDLENYWLKVSNKRSNKSLLLAVFFPAIVIMIIKTIELVTNTEIQSLYRFIFFGAPSIIFLFAILWNAKKAKTETNRKKIPPIGGEANAILAMIITSCWLLFFLHTIFNYYILK
jgi:hypothetical protein